MRQKLREIVGKCLKRVLESEGKKQGQLGKRWKKQRKKENKNSRGSSQEQNNQNIMNMKRKLVDFTVQLLLQRPICFHKYFLLQIQNAITGKSLCLQQALLIVDSDLKSCNFFQCFRFERHPMKNPFQNTKEYAIVRQFNRISMNNQDRSSSFDSSTSSVRSSGVRSVLQDTPTKYHKTKFELEYAGLSARRDVFQLERKRAKVFGVEELRYKPAYFDSLQKPQCSRQLKNIEPKPVIGSILKPIQQLRHVPRKSLNKKKVNIQEEEDKSQPRSTEYSQSERKRELLVSRRNSKMIRNMNADPVDEDSRDKALRISICCQRKCSLLSEMIELKHENGQKLNQIYGSVMDFKSKLEQGRLSQGSNQSIYSSSPSPSQSVLFQNPRKEENQKSSSKRRMSTSVYTNREQSFSESDSGCNSNFNLRIENSKLKTITVRKKVYYRYQNNDPKARWQ